MGSERSEPVDDPHEAVVEHLRALGVAHEVVACDPALADTAAFCAAYGYSPEESANTIVVAGRGRGGGDGSPARHVACVVLATTRLDVNRTVRQRLGVRKASFADAEATEALTGMTLGGVTPFGLPVDLGVWVDARVLERPRVVVGGGSRSWKVLCPPRAILAVPGAEVVAGLALPA